MTDMTDPIHGICVAVEDMPKFYPKNRDNLYLEMTHYLDSFLEKARQATQNRVFIFPSIEELSTFFRCTQSEVLHTVLRLGGMGYGREMQGTRQPLKLWKTTTAQHTAKDKKSLEAV